MKILYLVVLDVANSENSLFCLIIFLTRILYYRFASIQGYWQHVVDKLDRANYIGRGVPKKVAI